MGQPPPGSPRVTPSALSDTLRRRILRDGPIAISDFMGLAVETYYAQGRAFGRDGDFITAPDISQVFGELLGLWMAAVWQAMGAPSPVMVVELGPGRGTLMADALRGITQVMPAFNNALRVYLVEASPLLREQQRAALGSRAVHWHDNLAALPALPMILIGNEFLDALPIVQTLNGVERRVGLSHEGDGFVFTTKPQSGDVIEESSPAIAAVIAEVAQRVGHDGGAGLFIDYGYSQTTPGDTLQALSHHRPVPPLNQPGAVDLTAHVDFAAVARTATAAGVRVHGPITQARLLTALGIEARTAALLHRASPSQAVALDSATRRLLHPREMGTLFKALCVAHPSLPTPPGFDGDLAR